MSDGDTANQICTFVFL